MSDFLQIEDEVINGSPKYNITSNGDGTSSITLANEVVHSGTPLNKFNLNRLNEILVYNECTNTQTSETQESVVQVKFTKNTGMTNITWSNYVEIGHIVDANGGQIKIQAKTLGNSFHFYGGSKKEFFDYVDWATSINSYDYGYMENSNYYYDAWFKFEKPIKVRKYKIQLSNYSYPLSVTFYRNGAQVHKKNSFVYDTNNVDIGEYIEIDEIYFEAFGTIRFAFNDVKISTTTKTNNITSENYSNFANNQVVNIETPILPTESVVANTFNGKAIDTLLQSNKYYELMFDQPNDRFIAYETRV